MCHPDSRQPVEKVSAGGEAEIGVQLTAPEKTGRHTAYFRFQTASGSNFGQRLWADIRVIEEENDWAVVSGSGLAFEHRLNFNNEEQDSLEETSTNTENLKIEEITVSDVMTSTSTTGSSVEMGSSIVDSPFVPVDDDDLHLLSASIPEETPVVQGSVNMSQVDTYLETWRPVWGKELEVLGEMGFTDARVLIPLFHEHIGVPVSLCDGLNGVPPPDRIQLVVAHMLSQSGLNL